MRFVTRSAWGARPARSVTKLNRSAVDTIVYHYSAADADEQADHANCDERVRGIQRYHMDTQGWVDIAYNFLVCKHGYVFEGRGFANRSAATGNDNGHTVAVCFLGDDTVNRDDVTVPGRAALIEIARSIQTFYKRRLQYRGHRDYMATSCPGNEIHRYIRSEPFSDAVNEVEPNPKPFKWAYRVEEGGVDKFGKTDFPGLTVSRIQKRLKKGDRIILERLR